VPFLQLRVVAAAAGFLQRPAAALPLPPAAAAQPPLPAWAAGVGGNLGVCSGRFPAAAAHGPTARTHAHSVPEPSAAQGLGDGTQPAARCRRERSSPRVHKGINRY